MEKETLEEAAVLSSAVHFERTICSDGFYKTYQVGFKEGAKWMQERMYSEENMINFAWFLVKNLGQYSDDKLAHFDGMYLKQFKNQTR